MKNKPIAMLSLLALAEVASANQNKLIKDFQYGHFESSFTEAEFEPGDHVVTRDNQIIKQTSMIPAKLGTNSVYAISFLQMRSKKRQSCTWST